MNQSHYRSSACRLRALIDKHIWTDTTIQPIATNCNNPKNSPCQNSQNRRPSQMKLSSPQLKNHATVSMNHSHTCTHACHTHTCTHIHTRETPTIPKPTPLSNETLLAPTQKYFHADIQTHIPEKKKQEQTEATKVHVTTEAKKYE